MVHMSSCSLSVHNVKEDQRLLDSADWHVGCLETEDQRSLGDILKHFLQSIRDRLLQAEGQQKTLSEEGKEPFRTVTTHSHYN
jgi:hypothetical protein